MWVDNMVDKLKYKYIYKKRNVYYFSRHIPQDLLSYYNRKRIVFSLKTRSINHALYLSKSYSQHLEDEWLSFRVNKFKSIYPSYVKFDQKHNHQSNAPLLSSSLKVYFKLKGAGKGDIFFRASERAVRNVTECLGDRPINLYSTIDAATFRDYLFKKGLVSSSVKRVFAIVRAIINLVMLEYGIDQKNGFAKTFIPDLNDSIKRNSIPLKDIRIIQKECIKLNDESRWLIALISDTGMRLSEALGLASEDIVLHEKIPFIDLRPKPWRQLKTNSSERQIPLVGYSLWAAKNIIKQNRKFAFPKYVNQVSCNTNSASAALNKWMQIRISNNYVIHSFRHAFRDRMRNVKCPTELIDQAGGWSSQHIGQIYGDGYSLKILKNFMDKI